MPLNPSGQISLAGPVAGQSIAVELGVSATATISLNDTVVRTLGGVASGQISLDNFFGKSNITGTQRAIFGFGSITNNINLVSSTGVVAATTSGVGTARRGTSAAGYGGDKAIFGWGRTGPTVASASTIFNLVSNTGVVANNTSGVGTPRWVGAAAGYGGDKALFGWGRTDTNEAVNILNYISNTGVVGSNSPGVGDIKYDLAAAGYGGDKAIFGYGQLPTGLISITNLVSNTGVVATNTPGVGTARIGLAAANYGGDKAIFGFGSIPTTTSITNLVSNTGVVAANTPGVGTARANLAAAGYGGDKAIFGFGSIPSAITNLVSNTGVVATDTTVSAPVVARNFLAAAGYSTSP